MAPTGSMVWVYAGHSSDGRLDVGPDLKRLTMEELFNALPREKIQRWLGIGDDFARPGRKLSDSFGGRELSELALQALTMHAELRGRTGDVAVAARNDVLNVLALQTRKRQWLRVDNVERRSLV